jgi:hypothetical protein
MAAHFLPRHAPGAAQRTVLKHFGSIESFMLMLGEAPNPHDGQAAASMSSPPKDEEESDHGKP